MYIMFVCLPGSKSRVCSAGLTLGLLSLDMNGLKVLQEGGDPAEREHARLIMPIREKGNLLLCVLLTGNTLSSPNHDFAYSQ